MQYLNYLPLFFSGIQVCVLVNSSEICNPGVIDLPLDEEVKFQANVVPSTETVLRFIWQLGSQEIRRTNTPIFLHRYQQAGRYVKVHICCVICTFIVNIIIMKFILYFEWDGILYIPPCFVLCQP